MRGDLISAPSNVVEVELASIVAGCTSFSEGDMGKLLLPRLVEEWPMELMLGTESCDSRRFSSRGGRERSCAELPKLADARWARGARLKEPLTRACAAAILRRVLMMALSAASSSGSMRSSLGDELTRPSAFLVEASCAVSLDMRELRIEALLPLLPSSPPSLSLSLSRAERRDETDDLDGSAVEDEGMRARLRSLAGMAVLGSTEAPPLPCPQPAIMAICALKLRSPSPSRSAFLGMPQIFSSSLPFAFSRSRSFSLSRSRARSRSFSRSLRDGTAGM